MANSSIPLSGIQVDAVSPLLMLAQQQRAREQQEYERARQAQQDARLANQDQRAAELQQAQMQEYQSAAKQKESERSRAVLDGLAKDTIQFGQLVNSGDLRAAAMLANQMKQSLASAGMDTGGADKVLSLFNDPASLKTETDAMVSAASAHLRGSKSPEIIDASKSTDSGGFIIRDPVTGEIKIQNVPGAEKIDSNAKPAELAALELEKAKLENERIRQQTNNLQQESELAKQKQDKVITDQSTQKAAISSEAKRAYELTKNLLKNESGLAGAAGPIDAAAWVPSLRSNTISFESDVKELQNLLTLTNLTRMQGVLSNSDIQMLANAATGLDLRDEKRTKGKLEEIQKRLEQNPSIVEALKAGEIEKPLNVKGMSSKDLIDFMNGKSNGNR